MKILKFLFILLFFSRISNGQEISYQNGVVSSSQELASKVGVEILKSGGNAIDAAVGVGFTLAVVYPQAGNIGGGGFMMIHYNDVSGNSINTSIDYREKAPVLAGRDMYLNSSGDVISELSTLGNLAAGVPGSVAGMLYALEKYGTMHRATVMNYAINIADTGFAINESFADLLNEYQKVFSEFPSSMKVFGGNFKSGDIIVQKDLANTLRLIRDIGPDGFYKGDVAEKIVNSMENSNGIISYEDLVLYKPVERDVIKGDYRGYEVISMGPPSSGGISLIYLLNILENYDLRKNGYRSIQNIQVMTEAMRRVYADRSEFMGDADFVNVPIDVLTSKSYALERMKDYKPDRASVSEDIKPGNALRKESDQTTHYSIADKDGNLVSVTTTINDVFGNKVVVEGAGFFLNNEMDDFVSKPGVPNLYGLLGSEANSIAPQKRMLSSMTPTFVLKDNKPFLVVGSPGGGRIITSVLQTIINIVDYDLDLDEAIDFPRFHHQWFPDEIQVENNLLNRRSVNKLKEMGYSINPIRDFGRIDAVLFLENGEMKGYSDRRGYGNAIGY